MEQATLLGVVALDEAYVTAEDVGILSNDALHDFLHVVRPIKIVGDGVGVVLCGDVDVGQQTAEILLRGIKLGVVKLQGVVFEERHSQIADSVGGDAHVDEGGQYNTPREALCKTMQLLFVLFLFHFRKQ